MTDLDNHPCRRGVWPVMLTPFLDSGAVDFDGLDRLSDWYIESGVAGLFAVCLSSEMYQLSDRERVEVTRRVVARSQGRVKVVASALRSGSVRAWADEIQSLSDVGASAAVVIANHFDSGDFESDLGRLISATGDIPLGLYECPIPEWRLMTVDQLRLAASTERFVFFKDTCCSARVMEPRIAALANTKLRLFNADSVVMLTSLRMGAYGYSGIAANYFPDLCVWLCSHFESEAALAERLQSFLGVSQLLADYKYPQNAKEFLKLNGKPISAYSRLSQHCLSDRDYGMLSALLAQASEWRHTLGLSR